MDDNALNIVRLIERLKVDGETRASVLKSIPTDRLEEALQFLEEFGDDIDLEQIKKQAGNNV